MAFNYFRKKQLVLLLSFSGLLVNAQTEKRSVFVKKIDQEILLDGILDEAVWGLADSASDFWQLFPTDSLKAQDITEVKLLYNDTHIYIGATAKSSVGGDFIVSSLRRDYSARSNDNVTVLFDTFRDGQNAFLFGVNAYGVQREGLVSERGASINGFNLTWDIKWQSASKKYDDRFVLEIAIPFTSLKYPEGSQKWGFQSYRYDLQKNERSIWTNVDQNQIPINVGYYGEMVFEEPLKKNRTPLYLIPYINGLTSKEFTSNSSDNTFSTGGDLKVAVGTGLNLDVI